MSKFVFALPAILSVLAFAADAADVSVTDVTTADGIVTVTYSVSGAANVIVTAGVKQGGRQVGLVDVWGEMNKEVTAASHQFRFRADAAELGDGGFVGGGSEVVVTAWEKATPPPYMAIDLTLPTRIRYFADKASIPGGIGAREWKEGNVLFRRIPAKGVRWRMGAPSNEPNRNHSDQAADATDLPLAYVTNEADYYMAVYPATVYQNELMTGERTGEGPAAFAGFPHDEVHRSDWRWHPASGVTYGTVVAKAADFSALCGRTVRLPTEAEFEFAARGGSTTYQALYGTTAEVTVYYSNMHSYYGGSHPGYGNALPVGLLKPNAFDLYDMIGNVREWCAGPYDGYYNEAKTMRTVRGCDHSWSVATARAASRRGIMDGSKDGRTGYRLVSPID